MKKPIKKYGLQFCKLYVILYFIFLQHTLYSQSSNGCHFMKGDFIQVGVSPNGSFGTPQNVPAGLGYSPRPTPGSSILNNPTNGTRETRPQALGFVADYGKDGFTVGNPGYFGDYFMPGTVQEGWSVQSGSTASVGTAWSNHYSKTGTLANGYDGNLLGNLIAYNNAGSLTTSIWEGLYESNLNIKQTVSLNATKSYFIINVEFTNSSTNPINDIYYLRTVDADCDVQFSSSYSTLNKIPFLLPNSASKTLVSSRGLTYKDAFVGLGTKDCKAVPFVLNSGLFPVGSKLKDIYNKVNNSYRYSDSSIADAAIGLIFEIGSLAPGEKTSIAYAYVLNETDLDDAFAATEPGFRFEGNFYPSGSAIVKPTGTALNLEIVNSGPYSWTWAPPTNLSTTSGTNVVATVDAGPTTYTISGTGVGTGRCNNPNLSIIISPTPVITKPKVVTPVNYCLNQTATPLEASGSGVLTWYNSPTATSGTTIPPTPSTSSVGTTLWYVSLTTSLGESTREVVTVNITASPFVNISALKSTICSNDTTSLFVNSNGFKTIWTLGGSSLNIDTGKIVVAKPLVNTTFTAEVTNEFGCKNNSSILIIVNPLPSVSINALPTNIVCPKDSVSLISNSPSAVSYKWLPNSFLNNSSNNSVICKPINNITYTLIVKDLIGCENTSNISVAVRDFSLPKLGNDTSICLGDSLVLNPGIYTTYLWQNGTSNSDLVAKNIGTYIVNVNDAFGCKASDTLQILKLHKVPTNYLPNDTIICAGQPLTYTINGFASYNWSNGSISKTSTLRDIGKYYLYVIDSNRCKGVDSISLINKGCIPFQVPNAFTPNDDGKNETFKPLITQQLSNYLLRIYNRFGQIVFETTDNLKGWNGKLQGRKQPVGAYVYQIKFIDFYNKPQLLEGTVLLIR